MCKGKVYEGSQFVFIRPDKDSTVKATLKRHSPDRIENITSLELEEPTALYRADTEIHIEGLAQKFPCFTMPSMPLFTAVTDRKIYRPRDPVKLFAFSPHMAGTPVVMVIQKNGHALFTCNTQLNEKGVLSETLEELDEGDYEAKLTCGNNSSLCRFIVAEYTLSFMRATLLSHSCQHDMLAFELSLAKADLPYSGNLKVGLYCDLCKRVVQETALQASQGKASGSFTLAGHTGYFALILTTPEGDSATTVIPGTRSDVRSTCVLGLMGKIVTGGIQHPGHEACRVRGLYFREQPADDGFITLDRVVGEKVKACPEIPLEHLLLHLSDPFTGDSREIVLRDLKKGSPIEIEVPWPFCILAAGGIGRECHESFSLLMHPDRTELSIDAPSKALPGSEVEISITSSRKGTLMLVVADKRLEREDPFHELTEKAFKTVKSKLSRLISGKAREIVPEKEEMKNPLLAGEATEAQGKGEPGSFLRRLLQPLFRWIQSRSEILLGEDVGDRAMPGKQMAIGSYIGLAPSASKLMAVDMDQAVVQLMMAPVIASRHPGALLHLDTAASHSSTRLDFPHVIMAELCECDQSLRKKITLGDQIGAFDIFAFLFDGTDYASACRTIETTQETYVELDVPALISRGDEILGHVLARCPSEGQVSVRTAVTSLQKKIQKHETLDIRIISAGEVMAEIQSGSGSDVTSRTVGTPGREKVTLSKLCFLKPGETLAGDRIILYPGPLHFVESTVESLIQYPFG